MKKLIILLLLASTTISFAQSIRIKGSQATPMSMSPTNLLWVDRRDTTENRLRVSKIDSIKLKMYNMPWLRDSTYKWINSSIAAYVPSYNNLSDKPSFASVATSGSYGDLSNKPVYSTVATSGSYSDLTNKPAFAPVATSGSYADLTSKPTIPTNTNQLTNGAGFITSYTETDPLFDTKFSGKSTTALAEGTNLYYTDTRARASHSAGTGISYNATTGVITNSAPDQTVSLTAGSGIAVTGTYPSFTIANTFSSPSYNNAPGRPVTGTSWQISATRPARVSYSVTHTIALTLVLSAGSSTVYLEISPNNTTWTTINAAGYSDAVAVAVALSKTVTNNVQGEVPAGWYVRLRAVTSGAGSAAFASGQEVTL